VVSFCASVIKIVGSASLKSMVTSKYLFSQPEGSYGGPSSHQRGYTKEIENEKPSFAALKSLCRHDRPNRAIIVHSQGEVKNAFDRFVIGPIICSAHSHSGPILLTAALEILCITAAKSRTLISRGR
jgi:hypothetical protein